MTEENTPLVPNQIRQAVAVIKKLRPAYNNLLDFYEKIFIIQENSKVQIKIEPFQIPHSVLSEKLQENIPLIKLSEFKTDTEASGRLFKDICNITKSENKAMPDAANAIMTAVESGKIDLLLLFSSLLNEDNAFFENLAAELDISKQVLEFITYNSMLPSLSVCEKHLSVYLDNEYIWEKGYCPICGTMPGLSMLQGEGERFLYCSFCWHKWRIQRIFCPFCENKDSALLQYFYSETEEDYRVDTCDKCKKYIKTVDTRKVGRYFYPHLEYVSSLHLDIMAKESGFEGIIIFNA